MNKPHTHLAEIPIFTYKINSKYNPGWKDSNILNPKKDLASRMSMSRMSIQFKIPERALTTLLLDGTLILGSDHCSAEYVYCLNLTDQSTLETVDDMLQHLSTFLES